MRKSIGRTSGIVQGGNTSQLEDLRKNNSSRQRVQGRFAVSVQGYSSICSTWARLTFLAIYAYKLFGNEAMNIVKDSVLALRKEGGNWEFFSVARPCHLLNGGSI